MKADDQVGKLFLNIRNGIYFLREMPHQGRLPLDSK